MKIQVVPVLLWVNREQFSKYYTLMVYAEHKERFPRIDIGLRRFQTLTRTAQGLEEFARKRISSLGAEFIPCQRILLPWRQVEGAVELPVVFLCRGTVGNVSEGSSISWTRVNELLVQSEHRIVDDVRNELVRDLNTNWKIAAMFGDAFTSMEMQTLWVEITGSFVDPANFRQRIKLLVKKGRVTMNRGETRQTATRPAQLFRVSRQ